MVKNIKIGWLILECVLSALALLIVSPFLIPLIGIIGVWKEWVYEIKMIKLQFK